MVLENLSQMLLANPYKVFGLSFLLAAVMSRYGSYVTVNLPLINSIAVSAAIFIAGTMVMILAVTGVQGLVMALGFAILTTFGVGIIAKQVDGI